MVTCTHLPCKPAHLNKTPPLSATQKTDARPAVFAAVAAYMLWGMFPLYFNALNQVSALEILAHRVLWSVFFIAFLITRSRSWPAVADIVFTPRKLAVFALSAGFITLNWGFYIYAVISAQTLEGSMGYFIMPLVAVMMGALFFAERFSKTQGIAIVLALSGVAYQLWFIGELPWIALTLAFSFGTYGMLRKKAPAESIVGLFVETLLIAPLVIAYLIYLGTQGELYFLSAPIEMKGLLMLAGPVTAIPLILFAYGARKLRYSSVGLLQYINPSCQFLVAVFIFMEPFNLHNLITFGFIWAGLLLYSLNTFQISRRNKTA